MVWSGRLNRRSRRCRSRRSRWSSRRRRNVEGNSRMVERIQLNQSALPRLLSFGGRRSYVLDFIILIGWMILIG
jgi:hypothetical protein